MSHLIFCITTIRDTMRVGSFIRGIDQALKQLQQRYSGQLHIVYPACGPFAPLLLPLLSYYKNQNIYSADDISVTLIDIQQGAVMALQAQIEALELTAYIDNIVCQDATKYQPQRSVHMIVLEAMQHGFSREGHFELARHYANLLVQDGVFIPQQISVAAMLNVAQHEYVEQWQDKAQSDPQQCASIIKQRTYLGEIINVNLESLRSVKEQVLNQDTRLVECATLAIPHLKQNADKQMLMIYAKVNIYGDEWLDEYESGITQPLPDLQVCINFTPKDLKPGDLLVSSGDSLTFYYCLNGLPGFLATKNVGMADAASLPGASNA